MSTVEFEELSEQEKRERKDIFSLCDNSIEVECFKLQPGNVYMPNGYKAITEQVKNFPLRSDDVWLVTYPKSGTTWTQVITLFFGRFFLVEYKF